MNDAEREQRIRDLGDEMVVTDCRLRRLQLWNAMRALIAQRSRSQVARMERQKGLSK